MAWFIVKTEVEPVDIEALKEAFERLAHRKVAWSGKSVKETLLEQYKTECPCCGAGREEADIIYTFWVKSAICTNPLCKKEVPLFSDFLIAQKSPSIRYWRDAECPKCRKTFDWEVEPTALIAEPSLIVSSPAYSAGIGRTMARWAYSASETVRCPWCRKEVRAHPAKGKLERKKVPLSVLLCPYCQAVWQWRGEVPDTVACPVCQTSYNPRRGNVPEKGKFVCPACGTKDAIIASIRKLPEDQLLPMYSYAIEGYCPACGGDTDDGGEGEDDEADLFEKKSGAKRKRRRPTPDHPCYLTKNNGKFFKRVTAAALARYQAACTRWEQEKDHLPYPKSEIPEGFNTNQMIKHHYRYWHQMFNPRQLLCLSTLLAAIAEELDQTRKELFLSGFGCQLLRNQNLFCFYNPARSELEPLFSRHDFAPVNTAVENNVWGSGTGRGTWVSIIDKLLEGKGFATAPYDTRAEAKSGITRNPLKDGAELDAYSTVELKVPDRSVDWIVTDPPYADNVNYSELSDFWFSTVLCGELTVLLVSSSQHLGWERRVPHA